MVGKRNKALAMMGFAKAGSKVEVLIDRVIDQNENSLPIDDYHDFWSGISDKKVATAFVAKIIRKVIQTEENREEMEKILGKHAKRDKVQLVELYKGCSRLGVEDTDIFSISLCNTLRFIELFYTIDSDDREYLKALEAWDNYFKRAPRVASSRAANDAIKCLRNRHAQNNKRGIPLITDLVIDCSLLGNNEGASGYANGGLHRSTPSMAHGVQGGGRSLYGAGSKGKTKAQTSSRYGLDMGLGSMIGVSSGSSPSKGSKGGDALEDADLGPSTFYNMADFPHVWLYVR